ncbi:MAG: NAD(P)H-dependent glycerol-3-phosphate dehydrogenase [Flavobacteriales bacterium]
MEAATPTVGVIGGGSWATALMKILSTNLPKVHWWMRNEKAIAHIGEFGHNPHYIQAIEFDRDRIAVTSDMQAVIDKCDVLVFAIPSAFLDETVQEYQITGLEDKILFSAIKGMINKYDAIPARYFHKEFGTPYNKIGLICGPCHAEEVAQERLSYLTSACPDPEIAEMMAGMLKTRYINTFTSEDVFGAEIAAVLKNVYALASGICSGLNYGDNFQAVLVSSALREMKRFIDTVHEIPRNVQTSPYLGDLLVTAYSKYSRNRMFGMMVGKGYSVKMIALEMNMIAEGYYAAKGIHGMNAHFKANIPIAESVYQILYENKPPGLMMKQLAERLR